MDVVSDAAAGEAGGVSAPDSTHDSRGRPVVLAAGAQERDGAQPRIRWLGGVGLWAAGAVVACGVVAAASAWTVMESVDTTHDPLWVSPESVTGDRTDDRPLESPSSDVSHDVDDSGPRSNNDASGPSTPVTTDDSSDNSGPGSGDESSDSSGPGSGDESSDNSGPGSGDQSSDNSGPGSGGGSDDNSGPGSGGGSDDNSGPGSGGGSDDNSSPGSGSDDDSGGDSGHGSGQGSS